MSRSISFAVYGRSEPLWAVLDFMATIEYMLVGVTADDGCFIRGHWSLGIFGQKTFVLIWFGDHHVRNHSNYYGF